MPFFFLTWSWSILKKSKLEAFAPSMQRHEPMNEQMRACTHECMKERTNECMKDLLRH